MRSEANKQRRKQKLWVLKDRRKYYKFLCKVEYDLLKDYEKEVLYCAEPGTGLWEPLVYISLEDIEADYKENKTRDSPPWPCIQGMCDQSSASPWKNRIPGGFFIREPGYHRVKRKKYEWGTVYHTNYHGGFPYFTYSRSYKSDPAKWFERLEELHWKIGKKRKDEAESKRFHAALEKKQELLMKEHDAAMQKARVRGVTPNTETVNFFRALAFGGLGKTDDA
tara:strand:- start:158 stop:826 length:669 start_codon:yes stop_codon:yes gene_type:complete